MDEDERKDKTNGEVLTGDQPDDSEVGTDSRRTVLTTLLGIGGLSVVGRNLRASASSPRKARPWNRDVNAKGNDLLNLGSLTMAANESAITDFEGDGLSIDPDGILNASLDLSAIDPDRIDDFIGRYLQFDSADQTLQFTGPAEWGNAGTFTNTASDVGATVGGGGNNEASGGFANIGGGNFNTASSRAATIGGGARNEASDNFTNVGGGYKNTVTSPHSTVGGGRNNAASGYDAIVGGGNFNEASGVAATIGGGERNTATGADSTVSGGRINGAGECATVGGGELNGAGDSYSTVAGGFLNKASGEGASIPGGRGNSADGDYSFAAGRKANTNGHDGAMVFGDSSDTEITADAADEAFFQMPVNATSFSNTSSRTKKTSVESVDTGAVLDSVNELDITTWEYTDTDDGRHMGAMAEAFHDAFGLGQSAERINTVDADGVAMAAIQGLSEKLNDAHDEIKDLESEVASKDDRIESLEAEQDRLQERLNVIETRIEGVATETEEV